MWSKRDSRRRWKARANMGLAIPLWAIVQHDLGRWSKWTPASDLTDTYRKDPTQ